MKFINIKWQEGTIKETGENGAQIVDVLKECRERLQGLNSQFPCRENAITLTKIDEAIMWQNKRTEDQAIKVEES